MEGSKVEHSIELIKRTITASSRPALMCSFGKDSMVMAHLIREAINSAGEFPIDVIYHRDPWMPHKNEFADQIIRSWAMVVHDFPPMVAGVKVKPDMLELVSRYHFGVGAMDIPKNVCRPEEYPRRKFICGLNDWLLRVKTLLCEYPWDMVLMGHKSSDVDPFDGAVPLKDYAAEVGGVKMVFPLRDWTDEDVWAYIESERIPVQKARYFGDEKWYGNDWVHACTACIDPRVSYETVWCPKLKREVPNRGGEVLQINERPHYLEVTNHG